MGLFVNKRHTHRNTHTPQHTHGPQNVGILPSATPQKAESNRTPLTPRPLPPPPPSSSSHALFLFCHQVRTGERAQDVSFFWGGGGVPRCLQILEMKYVDFRFGVCITLQYTVHHTATHCCILQQSAANGTTLLPSNGEGLVRLEGGGYGLWGWIPLLPRYYSSLSLSHPEPQPQPPILIST